MAKSQRGKFLLVNNYIFDNTYCLHCFVVSIHDDSMSLTVTNNSNNHISTTNDFENMNGDDDLHVQQEQQQKAAVSVIDVDCYDTSTSLLDPQMAAYRAIMSRMVPFAHNVSKDHNSSKQLVKQEPLHTQDESSHGDESNSSSPLNDHLSP